MPGLRKALAGFALFLAIAIMVTISSQNKVHASTQSCHYWDWCFITVHYGDDLVDFVEGLCFGYLESPTGCGCFNFFGGTQDVLPSFACSTM